MSNPATATPKTKKSFGEWIKSRKGQKWIVIITFMFVPLLLLTVFTYVPFFKMVQFSFYKMKYIGPRTWSVPGISRCSHTLPFNPSCQSLPSP